MEIDREYIPFSDFDDIVIETTANNEEKRFVQRWLSLWQNNILQQIDMAKIDSIFMITKISFRIIFFGLLYFRIFGLLYFRIFALLYFRFIMHFFFDLNDWFWFRLICFSYIADACVTVSNAWFRWINQFFKIWRVYNVEIHGQCK